MKLFKLLVIARLEQIRSLRDISNILHNEAYSRYLELESISRSQIARRLRQVGTRIGLPKIRDYLGNIYLIDAMVISLCLTRYRWAEFRKTKSGIKLHLRLKLFEQGVLPEHAQITVARTNDKMQMDNLVVEEKDAINIFDRGYVDYNKFNHYCKEGIHFISRLKTNAVADVQKELPIANGSAIQKPFWAGI